MYIAFHSLRLEIMKSEEFSKNILLLDPAIRFAGLIERSGHLFAGGVREGTEIQLNDSKFSMSLLQSAHIVFLRERFSQELGSLRYVLYVESNADAEDIANKVSQYIESVKHDLSLHPPSNAIDKEKRETLRNLYDSGIPEEMIADQLDLDINTVRALIEEISSR
jgi:transcription initiation factor IIE alpha subunit